MKYCFIQTWKESGKKSYNIIELNKERAEVFELMRKHNLDESKKFTYELEEDPKYISIIEMKAVDKNDFLREFRSCVRDIESQIEQLKDYLSEFDEPEEK